jgi:hypothetical protein
MPDEAPKRTVIPNPLSDDPNAGIIVVEGDPLPLGMQSPAAGDDTAATDDTFDVKTATGKELDARFSDVDGYPMSAKVDERRKFVRRYLASL